MAVDIHVYVQDAYRESRRLAAVSQELRDYAARIQGQEEELDAIWRGVSARRVSAALLGRQDDASKLADNVERRLDVRPERLFGEDKSRRRECHFL